MEGKNSLHKFLFLFSLLFILFACEQTEDGCLDLLSSNYGFDAVSECEECCEYPDFKIGLGIINDTIENALNDTIVLSGGDTLIFKNIELLFSEIEIEGINDTYKILDSIEVNDLYIKDDYVYFQSPSTKIVGQTRLEDTIKTVSVHLGFNETTVSTYKPFENIDNTSQLDLALDSLYFDDEEIFYFSRIQIELADSIRELNLKNLDVKLDFELDQFVDAGSDWIISFNLDLNKLRDGITSDMTNELLIETFEQNFISSLSIK